MAGKVDNYFILTKEKIKISISRSAKLAEDSLSRKQTYPQTMVTKMISVSLPAYKAIEQRLQQLNGSLKFI